MSTFFVYHSNRSAIVDALGRDFYLDSISMDPEPAVIRELFKKRDFYDCVAYVKAADLDAVFEKTNHISHPWTENDGVEPFADKVRSTSVGDVILSSDGPGWIVAEVGFVPLNK